MTLPSIPINYFLILLLIIILIIGVRIKIKSKITIRTPVLLRAFVVPWLHLRPSVVDTNLKLFQRLC